MGVKRWKVGEKEKCRGYRDAMGAERWRWAYSKRALGFDIEHGIVP